MLQFDNRGNPVFLWLILSLPLPGQGDTESGSPSGDSVGQDLLAALCLVLVIEGMLPFLAPGRWRNLISTLADADERTIRLTGFVMMLLGAGLLYLVR